MIKIYNYQNGQTYDITNLCKSISNSGSTSEVSRKMDITFLYSITDKNHVKYNVATGSCVWVVLNGEEIFRGIVMDKSVNLQNELTVTVYDFLIHITKSTITRNFKNITAEYGTKDICNELGVKTGYLAKTGIKINRILAQKGGYDSIMELYTVAAKINGKKYMPVMNKSNLEVIEKGKIVSSFEVRADLNVLSAEYKESIEDMINIVKIYDSNNKYLGVVKNDSDIKKYGIFQGNYTKEDNINPYNTARNMLQGLTKEFNCECLGNYACRSGYAVNVSVPILDKKLKMYIDSDTHTWDIGTNAYTMQLDLKFNNTMDIKGD